jgi:hypothetical protein
VREDIIYLFQLVASQRLPQLVEQNSRINFSKDGHSCGVVRLLVVLSLVVG